MASKIDICLSNTTVGQITFDQAPAQLNASRTAGGFNLTIPATITITADAEDKRRLLLTDLRVVVSVDNDSKTEVQLGVAEDRFYYMGPCNCQAQLVWADTLSSLLWFEKRRNGEEARLKLEFKAQGCWLLPYPTQYQIQDEVRTVPQYIGGQVTLTYPKEVWVKMLRDLNAAENILLEIPLPTSPPTPWDKVWRSLVEARNAFEQGGTTGWKGCVTAVRLALEDWKKIEQEDMGPGWKRPEQTDLEARTKQQRIDNLRWHLLQCAHLGPHSSADEWSRDDAQLALSTVSALLAIRKP